MFVLFDSSKVMTQSVYGCMEEDTVLVCQNVPYYNSKATAMPYLPVLCCKKTQKKFTSPHETTCAHFYIMCYLSFRYFPFALAIINCGIFTCANMWQR